MINIKKLTLIIFSSILLLIIQNQKMQKNIHLKNNLTYNVFFFIVVNWLNSLIKFSLHQ